ncbi:MAG: ABC transporter six-transmembrane domain-containing protein [Planctomycetaceae bacterium]|nr:ABC transporter six-transmembrane domain-containing protein [Planctomycetaceae bacterium]
MSEPDLKKLDKSQEITANGTTLKGLFRKHRGKMLLTYSLFNVENLLRLAQPAALGWAINDLLNDRWMGVWVLVTQHLAHMLIGTVRKMYDTRAFTSIYSELATDVITRQKAQDEAVSRIAARSAMSREYVDFFEWYVPMIIRSGYSIIGALVMLGLYDPWLVVYCGGLIIPAMILNTWYSRKTLKLSTGLHNQLEHEIDIIQEGDKSDVREHFDQAASWRIRLSDAEAVNFGFMELFILGVIIACLVRFCSQGTPEAGDIFAVFRYVLMFMMGMDSAPRLVEQMSRLKDIGQRTGPQKRGGPGRGPRR